MHLKKVHRNQFICIPILHNLVDDIQATERYISEALCNGTAAIKLTSSVFDAIILLEGNSCMGTELRRRFGVKTDLRFLVVAKQLVFYRVVEDDHIKTARMLDGWQDYLALLF